MTRTTSKTASQPKELIGSLVLGPNIILAVNRADPEMTMTQVAEKTGMGRACSRRHPLTLARIDMTPAGENGITTFDGLRAELARIRSRGYAVLDQEMRMGIRSRG